MFLTRTKYIPCLFRFYSTTKLYNPVLFSQGNDKIEDDFMEPLEEQVQLLQQQIKQYQDLYEHEITTCKHANQHFDQMIQNSNQLYGILNQTLEETLKTLKNNLEECMIQYQDFIEANKKEFEMNEEEGAELEKKTKQEEQVSKPIDIFKEYQMHKQRKEHATAEEEEMVEEEEEMVEEEEEETELNGKPNTFTSAILDILDCIQRQALFLIIHYKDLEQIPSASDASKKKQIILEQLQRYQQHNRNLYRLIQQLQFEETENQKQELKIPSLLSHEYQIPWDETYFWNKLLGTSVEIRDFTFAVELISEMKKQNIKINQQTYRFMIKMLLFQKQTERVLRLLSYMDGVGLKPDAETQELLLKNKIEF